MRLLTIPHTGTHWLMKLVGRMRVEARHHHLVHKLPAWTESEACVVTLRDPILSRITTINRGEPYGVEVWGELPHLDPSRVFFLRLEAPDLQGLADFIGGSADDITVPPPLNTTEDATGLKAEYVRTRAVPGALEPAAVWLRENMMEWFRSQGCDYPWMAGA